ncbi:MAG: methyltransferase dimerization domain-containing protein [Bilophila wadsworthia]
MKDWTPSALLHASGMYWESCAIHAAVHLDVFTPLSGGPMTVTELADRTGCVPQSLDRLLTALCAMGLLIRQGETCELPPFSRDHLCRGNPGYLGHIVEHHRHLMPGWSKLDESVRENRPTRHRSSSIPKIRASGKVSHGDVQHRQRTGGTQRSAHRPFRPFPPA